MEKMTIKEMFERVIEIVKEAGVEDEAILVEKLEREIEKVSKKRTGLTKTQKENEVLVEKVFEIIAGVKSITLTEIVAQLKDEKDIEVSTQKASALVKKLVDTKRVERQEIKGIMTYKVIAE